MKNFTSFSKLSLLISVLIFFLFADNYLMAQQYPKSNKQPLEQSKAEVQNLINKELQKLQEEAYVSYSSSGLKSVAAPMEISETDSMILVSLYNTTDGDNWTNNENWLNGPISTWFGVTIEDDFVTEIRLKDNNLSGTIPADLGQLTSLQFLDLDTNQLTGPIPVELSQLVNLEYLYLNGNQLTGTIPAELGQLTNLWLLYLSDNQLTGTIPEELLQLTGLRWLDLSHNQLSGTVPAELEQLTFLQFLDLGQNLFTGTIPTELGQLSGLRWLFLSENQLDGVIPVELTGIPSLELLYLEGNQLTDGIPAELGQLSNMLWLDLSQNQLTGAIPVELGQMTNLTLLYLNENQLSGSIPAELGQCANLRWLNLNQNGLSGNIPDELWQLINLELIYLNSNQLTGTIPAELGLISGLQWLDLSQNNITGEIPETVSQLDNLQFLNVQSNQLNSLPDITAPGSLNLFDVSNNKLSFEDLEYNMDLTLVMDFFYAPQDSIGSNQIFAKKPGTNFSYAAPTGGEQNNYQWVKDNVLLDEQIASNLVIDNLAYEDAGKYYCVVTNDIVTDLTLTSKIITLHVDESAEICQDVAFKAGWQIFSAPVTPEPADLLYLMQPLIDNSTLVKVQDEMGNALEDYGFFGGWRNFIGNLDPAEGYKLRATDTDMVEICGEAVEYPFPIHLKSGWNIIGFPQTSAYDALALVQPLIDNNTLEKVQDETGKSIEDWGFFGGWRNFIGDFTPGKGYKVKLSAPDILWIQETYPKSARIIPQPVSTSYFQPLFIENGVDHMNINIAGFPEYLFSIDDEIAVYDGELCVGAAKIVPFHIENQIISIPVSSKDEFGMQGFTEGNLFTIKLWNSKQNKLFELNPETKTGTKTFVKNESAFISFENNATTNLEDEFLNSVAEIICYPNPFKNEITVEIGLTKDAEVHAAVYNQLGQKLKTLLINQKLNTGVHQFTWDGKNSGHQKAVSGFYYVRINIDENLHHRKIFLAE